MSAFFFLIRIDFLQDWKPGAKLAPPQQAAPPAADPNVAELASQIEAQGDKVRRIKSEKADKSVVDVEVS